MKGSIPIVGKAAEAAFGPWMGNLVSLLISVALLSSLSAYIIIGPRVYYAMAIDRLFFPFASKVHPRFKVPGRAILIQGTIAIIMVIVSNLEQLLIYIEFALLVFPILAVFGIFIARRRRIGEATAVRVWGYPFIPLFFLISSIGILVIAYLNRPLESTTAIATILFGIPLYFLLTRKRRTRD
jgi:APA family basic amino acid/polyamine antiporter